MRPNSNNSTYGVEIQVNGKPARLAKIAAPGSLTVHAVANALPGGGLALRIGVSGISKFPPRNLHWETISIEKLDVVTVRFLGDNTLGDEPIHTIDVDGD